MKKLILFTISILFSISVNAQFNKKKKDKIRAYKVAFLTEKLELTESEAEKFWPIYNTYDKKMMTLRREARIGIKKTIKEKGGLDKLSENEAKAIIEKMNELALKRHKLKTDFHTKITKVISYKKLLQLEISEHEFNRKLLRKLRHRKKR